jgi:hypothetical protein
VTLNALVGAVGSELSDGELAAVVGAQHPKLVAALLLRRSLDLLDGIHGSIQDWMSFYSFPII